MNYVSQCIYAGFMGSNDATVASSRPFPQDNVGTSSTTKWIANPGSPYYAWTSNSNFYNYITQSSAATLGTRIMASITTYGKTDAILSVPSNLVGALVQVPGSDGDYSHAVIITKQDGVSRSQLRYCGHTNDAYDLLFGDIYASCSIRVILPIEVIEAVECTQSTHSYSSLSVGNGIDASCDNCGYNRMYVSSNLQDVVSRGSQKTLTSSVSIACYRMAMKITTPSGAVAWPGEVINSSTLSVSYRFSETGLYTITVYARDRNPDVYGESVCATASHTYTVRVR